MGSRNATRTDTTAGPQGTTSNGKTGVRTPARAEA